MSTARFDTLQDKDGGNSIGQGVLFNGSAKARVSMDVSATDLDSFNVSSIADNGTGSYTPNLTNAMSDAEYQASGIVQFTSATAKFVFVDTKAAGSCQILLSNNSGSANESAVDDASLVIHGDLA